MNRIPWLNVKGGVSPFCLGSLNFGTVLSQAQCFEQLDTFFENGGNMLDTAHVYSDWIPDEKSRSEKIIGRWFASRGLRSKAYLATKGAHPDMRTMDVSRVTPECIVQDIAESLDYLQTDYIDLYFLHRDDPSVPVAELLDCLNEQVDGGTIRAIGCSNWTLERIQEANETAQKQGWQGFSVNQPMWSLAHICEEGLPDRYVVMDDALYAYHERQQMPAMCFSSQAKGYFVRKNAGENLPKDVLAVYQTEENETLYRHLEAIQRVNPSAMTDLPLQFFSTKPFPAVPIVSCDCQKHLEDCFHAFETDVEGSFPWPKV